MRILPAIGIWAACALVLLSAPARAQEAPQIRLTALERVRGMELEARASFWHGLQLFRGDGSKIELGYFGGGYDAVFQGSEAALASMATYRKLRISGSVIRFSGLATMATQLGLVAASELEFGEGLSLGLLIGSLVMSMTGTVLMHAADSYLTDAVQLYNRDLNERGRATPPSLSGGPSTRFAVSYRFNF